MNPSLPPTDEWTDAVRAVLEDFYERVFADVMIGFFFEGQDKQRLVDRETELALVMFGVQGASYIGRPLNVAHARHPIMGGHFARRTQLLADTLRDHAFSEDLARRWLEHTEALRPQITEHAGGDCD